MRRSIVYLVFIAIFVTMSGDTDAQVGPVRGKVEDESGAPLNGVKIEVTSETSPDAITAKTKKNGTFTVVLPELRWEYEFHFQLSGYEDGVLVVEPSRLDGKVFEVMLVNYRSEGEPEPEPVRDDTTTKILIQPKKDDISVQRESSIILYNEGVGELEAEDTEKAMVSFRRATVADPTFPEPYKALMALTAEAGNWTEAARTAKALLRFEPDDLDAKWTVYYAMLRVGDAENIASAARDLATAEPTSTIEMVDNAQSLFDLDEYEVTRALLKVVIEISPNTVNAYYLLGMSCNGLGDPAAARPALRKFLEVAPENHPDVEVARGILDYLE